MPSSSFFRIRRCPHCPPLLPRRGGDGGDSQKTPHISSEIYDLHTNQNIAEFRWPEFDQANLTNPTYELVVQINGKKRHTKIINTGTRQEEAEKICELEFQIEKKDYKKIIFVEDKIINFIG